MRKHFIWGRWRTDEELVAIAHEMNKIGRRIENRTRGMADVLAQQNEDRKHSRNGLAF